MVEEEEEEEEAFFGLGGKGFLLYSLFLFGGMALCGGVWCVLWSGRVLVYYVRSSGILILQFSANFQINLFKF